MKRERERKIIIAEKKKSETFRIQEGFVVAMMNMSEMKVEEKG